MTEQTAQPTDTATEANQLTLNDLAAMKSIIDIASARGTFKPNEMIAVGQTYQKLFSFLETVSKQTKQGA
jgi:hypothetical protein